MTHFTSHDYISAGLATLSRQVICEAIHIMPMVPHLHPLILVSNWVLKAMAHRVQRSVAILDYITSATIVLTEQAAFPMFLQVFNRFYGSIEDQIKLEEIQLRLLRKPQTAYLIFSPLHFLIIGEYCDAFQAHIDSHKAIIYAPWETTTATVTKVIDGDTIKIDATEKSIRIRGLQCPELSEERGKEAREYAVQRLLGKQVKIVAEHHVDIYARILADVFLNDDTDFAAEMIAKGFCKKWEEYVK